MTLCSWDTTERRYRPLDSWLRTRAGRQRLWHLLEVRERRRASRARWSAEWRRMRHVF